MDIAIGLINKFNWSYDFPCNPYTVMLSLVKMDKKKEHKKEERGNKNNASQVENMHANNKCMHEGNEVTNKEGNMDKFKCEECGELTSGPKSTGTPRHPRSKANTLCPACFREHMRVYMINTGQGKVGV